MITIGFSTRKVDPNFIEHIKNTCGPKNIEIIPFENKGTHSLSEAYNIILEKSTNDIVVLCHDDIYFDKKGWGNKLIKHFDKNPDYGILGAAGSIEMPESGQWWSDPSKMRGIVNHEHEGKKWESKYSNSLGNKIEQTVIIDGLFIALNKKKIKHIFDEEVKGFHFYDIYFSFKNHIEGVKVGVFYDIRITHKSIGKTNEEWDKNRIIFSEKFSDYLPSKIYQSFEDKKIKILLGVLNFQGLTGSEVSTLELAKGLSKNGCDVSVISTNIGKKFETICKKHDIKTYTTNNPPGFLLGDGKTILNTPQGQIKTEPGRLYKIKNVDFDIIQTNHKPITELLLNLYPEKNFLTVVRSEIIDLENPVVDDKVKKYIAIRPSIKDYLVNDFGIDKSKIDVIYNPFDTNRFQIKESPNNNKEVILFVGTMDYLRKKSIEHLIEKVNKEDKILWLVGNDTMGYGREFSDKFNNVTYFPVTDKIEEFYHKCDVTAGIMLGRTTIEGYLCGKPSWIYNVDKNGEIIDFSLTNVPKDLNVFELDYSINKFKNIYIDVYNK